jgi:hypothetical protein
MSAHQINSLRCNIDHCLSIFSIVFCVGGVGGLAKTSIGMLANGQFFFFQQPAAAPAVEVIPIKALFSHSSHSSKIKQSYI